MAPFHRSQEALKSAGTLTIRTADDKLIMKVDASPLNSVISDLFKFYFIIEKYFLPNKFSLKHDRAKNSSKHPVAYKAIGEFVDNFRLKRKEK